MKKVPKGPKPEAKEAAEWAAAVVKAAMPKVASALVEAARAQGALQAKCRCASLRASENEPPKDEPLAALLLRLLHAAGPGGDAQKGGAEPGEEAAVE